MNSRQQYVGQLKRHEMKMLREALPRNAFGRVLELGAGDGIQSESLAKLAEWVVATDINPYRMRRRPHGNLSYVICDAETVGTAFSPRSFDIVYSSNMLEHLPNALACLRGTAGILRDNGIAVHWVPSPTLKIFYLIGFYPNLARNIVRSVARRFAKSHQAAQNAERATETIAWREKQRTMANNYKRLDRHQKRRLRLRPFPRPHGVAKTHLAELQMFTEKHWRKTFIAAGFEIRAILRGPFVSGYAFNLPALRRTAEMFGLHSENCYILTKKASDRCRANAAF